MYAYIYIYMYVCMYVCIYIEFKGKLCYIWIGFHACMCMNACKIMYAHTEKFGTRACVRVCMCVCTHNLT